MTLIGHSILGAVCLARTAPPEQVTERRRVSILRPSPPGVADMPDQTHLRHNIASIASRIGGSYIAAYTTAKHGVLGLTRALAVELMPYNITVNAICPGYVNTPMTEGSVSNIAARTGMPESKAREALESTSPQKRLIEPEEVAAIAVFLAQDTNRCITGQAFNIDGGGLMS